MVRADLKQVFHLVLFAGGGGNHALAAALLRAVGVQRDALDVAVARNQHEGLLFGDEVFFGDVFRLAGDDTGAPRVAVLLFKRAQLVLHNVLHHTRVGKDMLQSRDFAEQSPILLGDFFLFQPRQLAQLHRQNRVRLQRGQPKAADHFAPRDFGGLGAANQADNLVQKVERNLQALQNVGARLGAVEFVAGAPLDHRAPMLEVMVHQIQQAHHAGHIVHQRQQNRAEGGAHRRVFQQRVEHAVRVHITAQFNHHAHARAVGVVSNIGDALNLARLDQLCNLLNQARLTHLIGHFGNHNRAFAAIQRLYLRLGLHHDAAAPCFICLTDAARTQNQPPGGEVGSGQQLHNRIQRAVGMLQPINQRVHHLAQVVGGDIGRHPNSDSAPAVAQQVGESRR